MYPCSCCSVRQGQTLQGSPHQQKASCCDQDMGVRLTGPESVEQLVQKLVQVIAAAPEASIAPGLGQLSAHEIGCLAKRLLNMLLLVLGASTLSLKHVVCNSTLGWLHLVREVMCRFV